HFVCEQRAVILGGSTDALTKQDQDIQKLRGQIKENKYFQQLDLKSQRLALKGRRAAYLSRHQIAAKLGLDADFLEAHYKVLSNYTHSFTFGLYLEFTPEIGTDSTEARHK